MTSGSPLMAASLLYSPAKAMASSSVKLRLVMIS
nr:MAG TPA: hypothetical protein [Caudoviricetes sp.]